MPLGAGAGLRGLRLAGLAFLLRLLHVRDGGAEGALQLRALFRNVRQHLELLFAEGDVQVDLLFALGHALEQPLGGDHGLEVAAFDAGFGLPVGFQLVPELGVVRGVFVGEHGGAGAQAVGEGIEADGRLPSRSCRTGRMLGIVPVGFLLLVGD